MAPRMLTFRTSITAAVMAFVIALGALLLSIQRAALHLAIGETASDGMDAASVEAVGQLQSEVSRVTAVLRVLSASAALTQSDEPSEIDPAIALFEAALAELPQIDSLYVGYDNGCWLQVRRISDLDDTQRARLEAPPGASEAISLIRPAAGGALPLRRIFRDEQGGKIDQRDVWDYGYDARQRPWYRDTMAAGRLRVSPPYVAYSIAAPVITLSVPLQRIVKGVIAADLKLDTFNGFVQAHRPGPHGSVIIFDGAGALIAHPDLPRFVATALTDPRRPRLPDVHEIGEGPAAAILQQWRGAAADEGSVRDAEGHDYLFRLRRFAVTDEASVHVLLLAAEKDFARAIRKLQVIATLIALAAGAAFIPLVWLFGTKMSAALAAITEQARKLQNLTAPDRPPAGSRVREVNDLGVTLYVAHRAVWSFAHFVPKEIVKGVISNSISTELGGTRQEITVLFTDVRGFTTIAEAADPDTLMRQTSRYFTALTDAFLAEGGTVDKFIGDAVMVFWNAPHPQPDHAARACRAALAGKRASEALNAEFAAEGLPLFFTRFGIHSGEAVIGNLGSSERMNYTALGNTVNLASRLEGLNKDYGTSILVSEAVRARVCEEFHLRELGAVVAKGMGKATHVYELRDEPVAATEKTTQPLSA
jgi:adenylate cyclase